MQSQQRGFSLLELLIALAIGLILILLVYGFTIGLNRSQSFANSNAYVQERSRFVFDQLNHSLYLAGFMNPETRVSKAQDYSLDWSILKTGPLNQYYVRNVQSSLGVSTLSNAAKRMLPIVWKPLDERPEDFVGCDGEVPTTSTSVAGATTQFLNWFWLNNNQELHCKSFRFDGTGAWVRNSGNDDSVVLASNIADIRIWLGQKQGTQFQFVKPDQDTRANAKNTISLKVGLLMEEALRVPNATTGPHLDVSGGANAAPQNYQQLYERVFYLRN